MARLRLARGLAVLVAALLWFPGLAFGHMTSPGRFFVKVKPETKEIELLLSLSVKDVGSFLKLDTNGDNNLEPFEIKAGLAKVEAYLASKITVSNERLICPAVEQRMIEESKENDRLFFFQRRRCEQPLTTLALQNTVMFEDIRGYMHYTRILVGKAAQTTVFSNLFPVYAFALQRPPTPTSSTSSAASQPSSASKPVLPTGAWGIALRFFWEGVIHILFGLDHVLFVLCLLLVAKGLSNLFLVITAFTLGHSITLVLSSLRLVVVPSRPVEVIIALSIAYIALENILRETPPPLGRFGLAAGFGLVHGFGFSYVLRDEIGLPTRALLPALVSFNLGVEAGQILIVLLVSPLLFSWMKRPWYRRFLTSSSVVLLLIALYWSIQRTFFP